MIASEKSKNRTENPESVGELRNVMDPMTPGRSPLSMDDLGMGQHETDATGHIEDGEELEKPFDFPSPCDRKSGGDSAEDAPPKTPPRDRDAHFRRAIRAAWPNVGGIQHRMDRYLPMDYDDMDWATSRSHKNYAKTYARWEEIEREKEVFRETHELNDSCLPTHASPHWRTGNPLPREWE